MSMDVEKKLVEAIINSANNGKAPHGRKSLACVTAFKLAKKYEVNVIEIGRLCNKHNIKICKCQLGCFP